MHGFEVCVHTACHDQFGRGVNASPRLLFPELNRPLDSATRTPPPSATPNNSGGLRYDAGKPRYDLIPPEFLDALAAHYALGAEKYAERNWEKGMRWGRCFASLMRHAWAWLRGEDLDPETKAHHMIAVAWGAAVLFTYHQRGIGADDRPLTTTRANPAGAVRVTPTPVGERPVPIQREC